MKKLTVVFLADPGHGWVKLSREKLIKLGIADKISPYSYQRNNWVFLEEDCDAVLLIERCKQLGIELRIKSKRQTNRRSKIRDYARFCLASTERPVAATVNINIG